MLDALDQRKTCGLEAIDRQIWNVTHTSTSVPHHLQFIIRSNQHWYVISRTLR